jgi:predicted small integral membrane protein
VAGFSDKTIELEVIKRMIPRMSMGNWLFWGIMTFIGVNLIWLGLVERFVPQWVGAIIGFLLLLAVFKYGPREKDEEE